ncbi:MAG: four helix bundle protein [Planctomycetota bacterium]
MTGKKVPRGPSPDLVVLRQWEAFAASFLRQANRWPKIHRFTLSQRLQNLTLDVLEKLVQARYEPSQRSQNLAECNMILERMRFLMRVAHQLNVCSGRGFENILRSLDETGRMLHGWRVSHERKEVSHRQA